MKHRFFTILSIILILSFSVGTMASCSDLETDDKEQTEQPGGDKEDPETPEEPEQPEEPENPDDGIVRILAIGNSFSQDAVEQYLYELFEAAGQKVIVGNLYIGGCTLETHYKNMNADASQYAYRKIVDGVKTEKAGFSLSEGLTDEEWDYVSLQQASGSSGKYDTYTSYLPGLIDYVQSQTGEDVTMMWHQTWAYASTSGHSEFSKYDNDQMTMFNAIVDATKQALDDNPDIKVRIPSGTAVQNGRTSWIGDNFCRDGYHLETTYGRYTAACTWYESISGNSVVGNSYAPSTIDDVQKAMAQNAAHLAVIAPDSVTDMVDFKNPGADADPLSAPVYIDFGAGKPASKPWNVFSDYSKSDTPMPLKDRNGDYTKVGVASLGGFSGSNNGVGTEPDFTFEFEDYLFEKNSWSDSFNIVGVKNEGNTESGTIELSGLEANTEYEIVTFSLRWNGTQTYRRMGIRIEGSTKQEILDYDQSVPGGTDLNTFDKTNLIHKFAVISDSNGKIRISIWAIDTTFACEANLNAIVIAPVN